MDNKERALYHQVHPLKLAVDIVTAAVSLFLLWEHRLYAGLAVMWLPSIFVSAIMVRFGKFERIRDSRIGELMRKRMTHAVEALRFAGLAIAALGAWIHSAVAIVVGALAILGCWGWCLVLPSVRA